MRHLATSAFAVVFFSSSVFAEEYKFFDAYQERRIVAQSLNKQVLFRVEMCAPDGKNLPVQATTMEGVTDVMVPAGQCVEYVAHGILTKKIPLPQVILSKTPAAMASYRVIETITLQGN